MAVKVAIIYYSATGTTYRLARAAEEGANERGAEVRHRKVHELASEEAIASNRGWASQRPESQHAIEESLDDLAGSDARICGTPTRYGLPTAQLKQFLDVTDPGVKGALVNKICSAFTSSGTAHGGQKTTMVNLNTSFYHRGAVMVGPGYAEPVQCKACRAYEAWFTSNNGALKPDETALASAGFQGRRVAELAAQFIAGSKKAGRGEWKCNA